MSATAVPGDCRRSYSCKRSTPTKANSKKAAFVNSVCHEVRTPLNCIMGFSELLCAEEITPESRAQYCEIIRDNRRQLRFLFDDMLRWPTSKTCTRRCRASIRTSAPYARRNCGS